MTLAPLSQNFREFRSLVLDPGFIQEAVDGLQSCRFGQNKQIIEKVHRLISAMRSEQSVRLSLKQRISQCATMLDECLKEHVNDIIHHRIGQIALTAVNIKKKLMVEVAFLGKLFPYIKRRYSFFYDPNYQDLHEKFPNLFSFLDFDTIEQDYYLIDMRFLRGFFDEIELKEGDALFNQLTLDYFQTFSKTHDQRFLKIPFKVLPHKEFYDRSKLLDQSKFKILNQFFALLFSEEEVLWFTHPFYPLDKLLEKYITGGSIRCFTYMNYGRLIPSLKALLDEYDAASKKGLTYKEMLKSPEHIKNIYESIKYWLNDATLMFELILKIDACVRRVISSASLEEVDKIISESEKKTHLIQWVSIIPQLSNKIIYPISPEKPFCSSVEEFKRLPLYVHFNQLLRKYHENTKSSSTEINTDWLISPYRQKQNKKKVKNTVGAAAAGAATAPTEIDEEGGDIEESLENLNQRLPDDLLNQIIQPSVPCLVNQETLNRKINDSLRETRNFLKTVFFSERVSGFWTSPEKGLFYRGVKQPDLSDPLVLETIKTHDFPSEILPYACNKLYAQVIETQDIEGRKEIQYYSKIEINCKMYDLEVTLTQMRKMESRYVLYHLFARKSKLWEESLKSSSKKEDGAEDRAAEFQLASVDSNFFTVDEFGNAKCKYRDREIKIFIQKQ